MYKFLGNSDIFSIGFSMFGFVKSFEKKWEWDASQSLTMRN